MQAVILAAGRGTRMGALTETMPKPMLIVNGKNLIQHKLDVLPEEIDEVVIVIGYLGDTIKDFFGDSYNGRRIHYVVQDKLEGTGKALWKAQDHLKNRFVVMMGDDIYSAQDIADCIQHPWSLLVKRSQGPRSVGGRVIIDEQGVIQDVIEGTHDHPGEDALISTAFYVMTPEIFKYPLVQIPGRDEWGLPQTLVQAVKDFPIKVVESKMWIQLSNAQDLKDAEQILALKVALK